MPASSGKPAELRSTIRFRFHVAEKTILVTGGAGFIGANFIVDWLGGESAGIVNLDKLTYAGNLGSLQSVRNNPRHLFVHGDICDFDLVTGLLEKHRPSAVVNFAAESHVDRSIHAPEDFVQTNVVGTFRLLEAARQIPKCRWHREIFVPPLSTKSICSLGTKRSKHLRKTAGMHQHNLRGVQAASDHLRRAYFIPTGCGRDDQRFHTTALPVSGEHLIPCR